MKFNINEHVRVRLTDFGREVMQKNHAQIAAQINGPYPFLPKEEDADGWSTWQLWHLMHEFGAYTINGGPVPFEMTIEIPDQERH